METIMSDIADIKKEMEDIKVIVHDVRQIVDDIKAVVNAYDTVKNELTQIATAFERPFCKCQTFSEAAKPKTNPFWAI